MALRSISASSPRCVELQRVGIDATYPECNLSVKYLQLCRQSLRCRAICAQSVPSPAAMVHLANGKAYANGASNGEQEGSGLSFRQSALLVCMPYRSRSCCLMKVSLRSHSTFINKLAAAVSCAVTCNACVVCQRLALQPVLLPAGIPPNAANGAVKPHAAELLREAGLEELLVLLPSIAEREVRDCVAQHLS